MGRLYGLDGRNGALGERGGGAFFSRRGYAGLGGVSNRETLPPMRFRGRYRIPSARLAGYDYASTGLYFVTCCTHRRAPLFGSFDGEAGVRLSAIGHLAASVWHSIPRVHPTVNLEALAVMPDHVHALLVLTADAEASLAHVVNQAKGLVTKQAHALLLADGPIWQARFHDRIVRTDAEAYRVRRYIARNPFSPLPPTPWS